MTWEAEIIAFVAMCLALTAKWQIGNLNRNGWLFNIAAIGVWAVFAVYISCYSCLLQNGIFAILAIRGWIVWSKRLKE